MKTISPPGIFNDAIGPIMRGPSSSHTAGSHRIGLVLKNIAGGPIKKVIFSFHTKGSLATTYHTQGSDIGIAAGLMGMSITDPNMPASLLLAEQSGLSIIFEIKEYEADHPNTYVCHVILEDGKEFKATAISTGGGLIELISLDDFIFSRPMDLPTLFIKGSMPRVKALLTNLSSNDDNKHQIFKTELLQSKDCGLLIVEYKTMKYTLPDSSSDDSLFSLVDPVYPVLGYTGSILPFEKAGDIEASETFLEKELWELAVDYESTRSDLLKEEVFDRMKSMVSIFMEAIDKGLSGTKYEDRILGSQSPTFFDKMNKDELLPGGPLSRITAYIMAIMEAKSAMEVIIAAPTAGAAGGMPGTLIGMAEEIGADLDLLTKAFLAAGLIGVFINKEATFAAEVAGCQAETGAGSGMAAAGLIQLAKGSAKQGLAAASIALQNILGLVCDPVGNRVEVPCLSRNVQSGSNALASANMILGGVDHVIPLSETIQTLLAVGEAMPRELRCTALGGLAITKTAKEIEDKLKSKSKSK